MYTIKNRIFVADLFKGVFFEKSILNMSTKRVLVSTLATFWQQDDSMMPYKSETQGVKKLV